jgi:hypothetical protein
LGFTTSGYTVPEHVLVLNVLRGLPSSYEAVRTLLTHQQSTPTFLCRSVMPSPWRSSPGPPTHLPRLRLQPRPPPLAHSSLPHHRPSPRCPPLSLVLLPPGRTGVDGAVGAAEDAVGGRGTPTQAPTPPLAPLPGGTPWPNFSNPWSWRISMWPHRVREGGLVPCTSLRPWSRVPPPTR